MAAAGLLAIVVSTAVAGATAAQQPPGVRAGSAATRPPVIHEPFTLLPCDKSTTIGMEGCYEHQIVAADHRIDRETAVIFGLLGTESARRQLAGAESAWLAYRAADCTNQSDAYEGGSEAPVAYAACLVRADRARTADLKTFYGALAQGRSDVPAFP
jgi:uncharacterized protein YecT (DUF1311 family)